MHCRHRRRNIAPYPRQIWILKLSRSSSSCSRISKSVISPFLVWQWIGKCPIKDVEFCLPPLSSAQVLTCEPSSFLLSYFSIRSREAALVHHWHKPVEYCEWRTGRGSSWRWRPARRYHRPYAEETNMVGPFTAASFSIPDFFRGCIFRSSSA